jgi:RimJ/RimL family protein N-acetyltransferase
MTDDAELVGEPAHVALQRRLRTLDPILARARGVFNAGRGLGVEADHGYSLDDIAGFARELGAVTVFFVAQAELSGYEQVAARAGLAWRRWQLLESGPHTAAAATACAARPIPEPLALRGIDGDAPPERVRGFQALCASRDVTAMPGYVLRGHRHDTVTQVLVDRDDQTIASVHLAARHGADSPHAGRFFLGLIAVRADHQGRGLGATITGHGIEQAYRRFGARGIYAAVRDDNVASTRMCGRCGLGFEGRHVVVITDPRAFDRCFTR